MPGLFAGTPWEQPVLCERCGAAVAECTCLSNAVSPAAKPAGEQDLRVRRERRRGKWNTIVTGLDASCRKAVLKDLRTALGAGGGEADGELVLQGEHREAVVTLLIQSGFRAKAAGG